VARLRLSKADVAAALRGLSDAERAELLALLLDAEQEAASMPVDDREPLEAILDRICHEAAEASDDPPAWWAAHEAHEARRKFYYDRLAAERPEPVSVGAFLSAYSATSIRAGELAAADGFPEPPCKTLARTVPA
jgi:hypothetical protein